MALKMTNHKFDLFEGEQKKAEGMSLAASNRSNLLGFARKVARDIALLRPDRTASADDVGRALRRQGITQSLGNAAGSLFRGREWIFTGKRIKSKRVSNHAREIKVWRLREDQEKYRYD